MLNAHRQIGGCPGSRRIGQTSDDGDQDYGTLNANCDWTCGLTTVLSDPICAGCDYAPGSPQDLSDNGITGTTLLLVALGGLAVVAVGALLIEAVPAYVAARAAKAGAS